MASPGTNGLTSTTLKAVVGSTVVLPDFPSDDPFLHEGRQWKEVADSRLAPAGLLIVAHGKTPVEVDRIIDTNLDDIPELPPEHPHYQRRMELRLKHRQENEKNEIDRCNLTMRYWTALYTSIAQACEKNAPMLFRQLIELCDLSKRTPPID